jgi:hypothetical protein
VVICILAIAVINIGLGFVLAIYLARRYHSWVVYGTHGEPAGSEFAGVADRDPVPAGILGRVGQVDPCVVTRPGPDAQTVEGLRAQVQECNDQLAGLESQVLRRAPDAPAA